MASFFVFLRQREWKEGDNMWHRDDARMDAVTEVMRSQCRRTIGLLCMRQKSNMDCNGAKSNMDYNDAEQ